MLKCKECKQYKKDVKLRINKFEEAIVFDYTKKPKQNLCKNCFDNLQEAI